MSSKPTLSGAERDKAISQFAVRYPEDDPLAREVRDAADLAVEPRRPAPRKEVLSAFFSRGRKR